MSEQPVMHKLFEKTVVLFSWLAAVVLFGAFASVIVFMVWKGGPSLGLKLIFGKTYPIDALLLKKQVFNGILPAITGTILLVALSVSWAAPVGIASGIYLSEYAGGLNKKILDLFFDVLAGVPSIVVGLFGFSTTVFLHKYFSSDIYPCLLISSIALALLVLPYIARTTQISLEALPTELRMTAPALGASKAQNIFRVMMPLSLKGIIGGVILAIGRCSEDTAVVMLTGAAAMAGMPKSLFSGYEALPFHIYYVSSQYSNAEELASAFGAAIVLLIISVLLFSAAFALRKSLSDVFLCRP